MLKRPNQHGFTIVELMIATAVFSVVLLIVSAGVISFSKQYYKGIISNRTQNVARSVVTELAQSIQFSTGDFANLDPNGNTKGVCINGRPYYYIIGRQLGGNDGTGSAHALVTSEDPCGAPVPDLTTLSLTTLTSGRELLGKNMRLANFSISPSGSSFEISIRVAYGDIDLLCSDGASGSCASSENLSLTDLADPAVGDGIKCRPVSGNQFCATSGLTTNVINRIQQ